MEGKKIDERMSAGRDELWSRHKGAAFPVVAEAIQLEVEEYKGKEEEIKRLKQNFVSLSSIRN